MPALQAPSCVDLQSYMRNNSVKSSLSQSLFHFSLHKKNTQGRGTPRWGNTWDLGATPGGVVLRVEMRVRYAN